MNSVPTKTKKSANDRFIPRRCEVYFKLSRAEETGNYWTDDKWKWEMGDFKNMAKIRCNTNNYKEALRTVLMPLDKKVLNFFPPKKHELGRFGDSNQETWPVQPRKKPVIGPPSALFDLPTFDSAMYHQTTDWSCDNSLATACQHEVHIWYESGRLVTNTQSRVQSCIKWNPKGDKLAISLFPNRIGIWDLKSQKMLEEAPCCDTPVCEVLCFEWLRDSLVTGCIGGDISLRQDNLLCIVIKNGAHDSAIINMKISCNERYLATCSLDKTIKVWSLPEFQAKEALHTFQCESAVETLAWHPWREHILAFGHPGKSGGITIWNLVKNKVHLKQEVFKHWVVDCLTFNPITAELVAGLTVFEDGTSASRHRSIIAVFSDIQTIVEELHLHGGKITSLLWGYGGNKLASTSVDENLCIWDFFGPSELKHKKQTRFSSNSKLGLNLTIR